MLTVKSFLKNYLKNRRKRIKARALTQAKFDREQEKEWEKIRAWQANFVASLSPEQRHRHFNDGGHEDHFCR